MKERIQKVLANAGVASRRKVEEMVLQGRVAVNGRVVTDLPVLIDPEKDRVEVDGERVNFGPRRRKGGAGADGVTAGETILIPASVKATVAPRTDARWLEVTLPQG